MTLPPHLAHKSTVALILTPEDSPVAYEAVQAIRQAHDKSFKRWPPHINLLYPFLAKPSSQMEEIVGRIQQAVQDIPSFQASFTTLDQFVHSKKSATIFLEPEADTAQSMKALQQALQAAFPECNHDTRPFVPHLTLGQAPGERAIQALAQKLDQSILEAVKNEETTQVHNPSGWELKWTVGRVVVLERQGFEDPFEVVGQVELKVAN